MTDDTKTEDEPSVTAQIVTVKGEPVTYHGVPLVIKVPPKAGSDGTR